jgi:hypothetical protein
MRGIGSPLATRRSVRSCRDPRDGPTTSARADGEPDALPAHGHDTVEYQLTTALGRVRESVGRSNVNGQTFGLRHAPMPVDFAPVR